MSHFPRLPREVRDLIYEYCLVVEGILDPCTPYYEEKNPENAKRKPETALLRVNRSIGDEAAQMLYGKNVWRISYKEDDPSWPDLTGTRRKNIFRYMRNAVLSFDSRDVDHESIIAISRARFTGQLDPDHAHIAGESDAEYIHIVREVKQLGAWTWKRQVVDRMELKSIVLDFSNCFCPSGCCRLFSLLFDKYAFEDCHSYWPDGPCDKLIKIEISGLIDDEERELARRNDWIQDEEAKITACMGNCLL